jgi:ribonuclease P protein component
VPGRVHSRRQFERLARSDHKGRCGTLRVVFVASDVPDEHFAAAYAISKNVGGAVERNRIRRRLRAAMDELAPTLATGLYLIKCDFGTKDLTYEQLRATLERALRDAVT